MKAETNTVETFSMRDGLKERPLPHMRIRDKVIRERGLIWLVIRATDLKTAKDAITNAACSGSVGSTSIRSDGETGKVTRYAEVNRIELTLPYGANRRAA